jgi:hypothetical protein
MTNPTTQTDPNTLDMRPKTVTISAELSDAYVRLQRAVEAYFELGNAARMKRVNMALEDVRKAGVAHV